MTPIEYGLACLLVLVMFVVAWRVSGPDEKERPGSIPQYTVFLKSGEWFLTTISHRMQIIPRTGEYFIHGDQYYKINQVMHGPKNHIYITTNEVPTPLSEHYHEGLRNATILTHALDTGILKVKPSEDEST